MEFQGSDLEDPFDDLIAEPPTPPPFAASTSGDYEGIRSALTAALSAACPASVSDEEIDYDRGKVASRLRHDLAYDMQAVLIDWRREFEAGQPAPKYLFFPCTDDVNDCVKFSTTRKGLIKDACQSANFYVFFSSLEEIVPDRRLNDGRANRSDRHTRNDLTSFNLNSIQDIDINDNSEDENCKIFLERLRIAKNDVLDTITSPGLSHSESPNGFLVVPDEYVLEMFDAAIKQDITNAELLLPYLTHADTQDKLSMSQPRRTELLCRIASKIHMSGEIANHLDYELSRKMKRVCAYVAPSEKRTLFASMRELPRLEQLKWMSKHVSLEEIENE